MTELAFKPWPKMARLTRECVITEKIDGTNAQVNIVSVTDRDLIGTLLQDIGAIEARPTDVGYQFMYAGSRTRYVTPDADNMGFARWAKENADQLWALGPGRHFGEWWGSKVQRGYGQAPGVKHFSLFNTSRWADQRITPFVELAEGQSWAPDCCRVVPTLYRGLFNELTIAAKLEVLRVMGSVAAPGFMDPEGIVIFHSHSGAMFKKTIVGDEKPKGANVNA